MKNIYLGDSKINSEKKTVEGHFTEIQDEKFYKISNYDEMPDFFMTIVSDSDHWMYLSSNGSLTAGRKNRDNALFPYYTDDKIHDYKYHTGSKTSCLITKNNRSLLWEPFTEDSRLIYNISRNLYKSIYGNKIIFEEINLDLDLTFQYGWYNSEKFGWVRKSVLINHSDSKSKLDIIDGIQNLLPAGVDYAFQNEYSNLLDAYKKNELLTDSKLGLFMLSSIPVDRAEPSEALKATTVFSYGLDSDTKYLLSVNQLQGFKKGNVLTTETDIRARRGAYLINASIELEKGKEKTWYLAAEVNQDSSAVANLDLYLKSRNKIDEDILADIKKGTSNLVRIVANADGLQMSREELCSARHFSNTLFNIMRGGIFTNNYEVDKKDLLLFVDQTNNKLRNQHAKVLESLPDKIGYKELGEWAKKINDPGLERICMEYLPLTFSRRHGDPSRPWNQFSIEIKNSDGSDKLSYQGNWRDIFQNWEALSLSYPEFIEAMVGKFLNASTADGYNPYRITREGIDWEAPDPDDPWAYIGYWGDHQIIYLQKILEHSEAFHPGKLDDLLTREIFVFANVPYRIKPFEEIVRNPQDTIVFDHHANEESKKITKKIGADGRLLSNVNGEIFRANLTEKILITLFAKLSNFIPGAGIWLNTQRPEWNDANNALVGSGVSMVTLYYMRRFLKFWENKFSSSPIKEIPVAQEIHEQFEAIFKLFAENLQLTEQGFSAEDRYNFTSYLGMTGSNYRNKIYNGAFSGKKQGLPPKKLSEFCKLAIHFMDQSIRENKREDQLYHAYNLVSFKGKSIRIRHLYEMLEGQVAVLSSGYLNANESLEVLDALKGSSLFRKDQYSYILYPDRQLARFVEKNNIPEDLVKKSDLLRTLLEANDTSIVKKDQAGKYHFNSNFRNASMLGDALDSIRGDLRPLMEKEKESILDIFEEVFDHQSFTGRSGTFYGYEGLGSIYWHMVSKLLLATQECYFKSFDEHADQITVGRLKDHYYEIKAGIGLYKSPALYGAFPTDAYSHTPGNAGAKQPGLTGQVKEDFISRFGELGVMVNKGILKFTPTLLNPDEILSEPKTFSYVNLHGKKESIVVDQNQLAFTFCQVPVIYRFGDRNSILLEYTNGKMKEIEGDELPETESSKIFSRNGELKKIEVSKER